MVANDTTESGTVVVRGSPESLDHSAYDRPHTLPYHAAAWLCCDT